MSNNPAKYKVLIKQYSRSILDISAKQPCNVICRVKSKPITQPTVTLEIITVCTK